MFVIASLVDGMSGGYLRTCALVHVASIVAVNLEFNHFTFCSLVIYVLLAQLDS